LDNLLKGVALAVGELVEPDTSGVTHLVRIAADSHHTSVGLFQRREKLLYQVEVTQVVGSKLHFHAIFGLGVRAHHYASIENEDVKLRDTAGTGSLEVVGEGLYVRERRQVKLSNIHIAGRRRDGGADVFLGLFALCDAARSQDNMSTLSCQLTNCHLSDSSIRSGNDGDFACIKFT